MNKTLYYLFIFITFFSCSKKERGINLGSTVFNWEYSNQPIQSLFDTILYIPLESHPDGLFKNADKLMIHDNKYFIFDYFGQNQVNVFDANGLFLYKVGKKGLGPGEYVEIRNFTIADNYVYLIDNKLGKVLIYDAFNGNFIGDKVLPFYAHDMIVGNDGNYIFAQQKIQGESLPEFQCYNVFITDSDLTVKYSLFPFKEENCGIRSQLRYFSQTDQYIVFRTMVADSIVLFNKQDLSDKYHTYYIDFGSNKIPEKFENDDEMLKNYNCLFSTPIISSKYLMGTYWAGKDYGFDPYIYDMQKKKAFVENDDYSHFLFTPLLNVNDTVYSIYNHDYFNLWINNDIVPDLPDHIIHHLNNGDDVLIKYILNEK